MATGCITACRVSAYHPSSVGDSPMVIRGSSLKFQQKEKKGRHGRHRASLIMNPESFEVGRLIGSYGFMNVTSYSGLQSRPDIGSSSQSEDVGGLRFQDVREGDVQIRLYEGRVTQGPCRGTPIIFKVYPGKQVGGLEADMMASNELKTHAFLQTCSQAICQNIQILLGGFETKTGEQWLAFRNDGKYCAADYAKSSCEKLSKNRALGEQKFWNPFEQEQYIKRKRYFIIKLLQGALRGLAYMHDNESTMADNDVAYLVPRLRDLAFSVDIRTNRRKATDAQLSTMVAEQVEQAQGGLKALASSEKTVNLLCENFVSIERLCQECQTLIENHDQIKLLRNARNNLNTTLKDVEGMMSISAEAAAAQEYLSDDKELINTYERLTALDGKRRFALAAPASHEEEVGRLRFWGG